jgi:hypothetical protein
VWVAFEVKELNVVLNALSHLCISAQTNLNRFICEPHATEPHSEDIFATKKTPFSPTLIAAHLPSGNIHNIRAEPVYNDIALCDTSSIPSDILRYQLIPFI